MDPSAPTSAVLSTEVVALGEGITLLFSRWTAVQMAVENGWGGPDSRCKEAKFAAEVHTWFAAADPKVLYIDDLEELLRDRLVVFFRTEADDGSVAEVAEKLMVMHEECLAGNFSSVERLRATSSGGAVRAAVARSRRVAGDDEDETSSSDEEDGSEMMEVDELKPRLPPAGSGSSQQRDSGSLPVAAAADEDGWSVVAPRRHRGKK